MQPHPAHLKGSLVKKLLMAPIASLFLACGGSAPPPAEPPPPPPAEIAVPATASEPAPSSASPAPAASPSTSPEAFAEQAKAGQALYGAHCASCHGPNGNDGKAPPVVGLAQGALPLAPPPKAKFRTTQFKTVADVAAFVVKTMPPKAPGSLSSDEYYAVLAFDLKANGVDLGDKKLDAALASSLEIPRK
jgi:S-disulfanyl-L-cysteine oxidoreductase SoxD